MSAAKKYIKKYNKIAVTLKDICRPVTASDSFKQQLFARIEADFEQLEGPRSHNRHGKEYLVHVIVHTESDVLNGQIALPEGERLSDFLNSPLQFIKVINVLVTGPEGKQETLSDIHVNKAAIKMIRTEDLNTARGSGPAVPKIPVHTSIHMPDYVLDGILHCKKTESVSQLMETDSTFLPCTSVNIRDIHTNDLWHTGFAAINRKLVSALHRAE
jgi:hypothetical protein